MHSWGTEVRLEPREVEDAAIEIQLAGGVEGGELDRRAEAAGVHRAIYARSLIGYDR